MCKILRNFLFLIFVFSACDGARILALFSSLSHGDHVIYRGYIELLAKHHHVIIMTPFPGYFEYPVVEHIVEIDVSEASTPFMNEYKTLVSNTNDYLSILPQLNDLNLRLAVAQIRSQQMSSILINPNIKFDMVITEADMPLLYAFAEKYKAPHVSITASHGKINMYDSKGNPNHPLIYPDVYAMSYGKRSIWEKVKEVERHIRYRYEYYSNFLPKCHEVAEKIFSITRDLQQIEFDIDLLLVSGTHMLIGNRPTVPAIIYVDRIHLKPGQKLPQDLQTVLDTNDNGIVYFSLGATQELENQPQYMVQSLLDAFAELPYTVLCKLENTTSYKVPTNVVTRKWFPQQELLEHPNIRLFITHGGPRSLEEAIYYEVPIVAVPIVTGATVFTKQLTKFGVGIILDPNYLDKDTVKKAVLDVASNVTYKKAMSNLKGLAFDQPMTGRDRALWWTEYVMRHNGARHLRAPAVGVPLYKYFMLDVLAVLLALVLAVMFATYIVVRRLLARCRNTPETKDNGKWKML